MNDLTPEIAQAQTDRNKERLDRLLKIRIDNPHLWHIAKDEEWKRKELIFRYWATESPGFAQYVKNQLATNPHFFKTLQFTPTDTILRDNRELEKLGIITE